MTKEEIKIHKLTKSNTYLNRGKLDKSETYIKNIKNDYKDIYGSKGIKFCDNMQMKPRPTAKKNNRVIFTNKIEYSKSWKLLLIKAFILIKTIKKVATIYFLVNIYI